MLWKDSLWKKGDKFSFSSFAAVFFLTFFCKKSTQFVYVLCIQDLYGWQTSKSHTGKLPSS